MSASIDFLAEHGPRLAFGVSVSLLIGLVLVLFVRQPVHKQRLAETTILGSLLWLLLAILPLPRFTTESVRSSSTVEHPRSVEPERVVTAPPISLNRSLPSQVDSAIAKQSIELPPPMVPAEPLLLPDPRPAVEAPIETHTSVGTGRYFVAIAMIAGLLSILALIVAWIRLRLLVVSSSKPHGELLREWLHLDPPKRARLLSGPVHCQPLSFGIIRPTVCVSGALTERGEAAVNAVLRHELAHIRHGDALSRSVFNFAMPILALHPLYWLLRSQATFAAELRADARAANDVGAEPYVSSLVELFNQGGRPRRRLAASTVWTSESAFLRRMTMLLKRERPIEIKSPRRWTALMGMFAVVAAAVSANQFGVVYAQSDKSNSKSGDETTAVPRGAPGALTLTYLPTNIEATQDGKPLIPTSNSADAQYSKAKAAYDQASKAAADDRNTWLNRTVQGERLSTTDGDGGQLWNGIALRIADRKAKLAGLKASPMNADNRRMMLQLEVEIANLEFERQISAAEQQLAATLNQMQRMTLEATMATDKYGDKHPEIVRLQQQVKYLHEQAERLKATIEDRKRQEEDQQQRLVARAMSEIQKVEDRPLQPGTDSPAKKRVASDIATDQLQLASATAKDLQRRLQSAEDQIAKLQAENDMLRKSQLLAVNTGAAPTSPDGSGVTSIPYLKHQLRMAMAEPALLESRVIRAETELKRTDKLFTTGTGSQEEVENARANLNEAMATLQKSKKTIESLQTLIQELSQSNPAPKPQGKQPTTNIKR